MSQVYLGYRDGDADTDYGAFFDPEMAALPDHVVTALQHGPQADQLLLEFDGAAMLLDEGYQATETGYGWLRAGGFQVSVRTDMPGVTPQMWQWWFGWHGSQTRRYKLWHPRAHASARWADGVAAGHHPPRAVRVRRACLVVQAADHGDLVHLSCEQWEMFADVLAGDRGLDRFELTADVVRCIGLQVPGIKVTRSATQQQEDTTLLLRTT